jgi:hypothetical protein
VEGSGFAHVGGSIFPLFRVQLLSTFCSFFLSCFLLTFSCRVDCRVLFLPHFLTNLTTFKTTSPDLGHVVKRGVYHHEGGGVSLSPDIMQVRQFWGQFYHILLQILLGGGVWPA